MRRLTVALAVLTLELAAAACEVASEVFIDVAEDGSGTVAVGVGTDVATAEALGDDRGAEGYESLFNLEDLGAAGWTYQGLTRESDNLYWLRASKPFGSSSELSRVLDEIVGGSVFTNFALERKTSFARQEWTLAGEVTLDDVAQRVAGEATLGEAGLLDLVEFIRGIERGAAAGGGDTATTEGVDIDGDAVRGGGGAGEVAQALTFHLEARMPGSLSEGYQQGRLDLDGIRDTSGEINVKTEAVNDTLLWVRTMAMVGSALIVVMLLIRVISKSAASRRRKVSAKTLLKKAREEEVRERSAKKRKARARARAAAAAELDKDEFESFAPEVVAEDAEDADRKEGKAEPPIAEEESSDQAETAEPPSAKGEDGEDIAGDTEAFTEEESPAETELESPPDEESLPDETDFQGAVTAAREPEAVNNQPASRHLQMLCVGLWGVLFNPPESLYELLIPFVRKMDSGVDENLIRSAYREAALGQITPGMLWRNCGLDGPANWPAGGPESERVSINPGASELLQRVTEQGISVVAVGEAIGSWVREFLPESGLDGLSSLMLTNEIGLGEDDPDFYKTLADYTDIPPSSCLLIHTRKQALDAAVRAGMSAAGYGESADESAHPKLGELSTLFGS